MTGHSSSFSGKSVAGLAAVVASKGVVVAAVEQVVAMHVVEGHPAGAVGVAPGGEPTHVDPEAPVEGAEEDVGDARTTDPTMILTLLFSSHVCRACRHEAGIGPWTAHDVEAGSRASCLQHFRQHAVLEALGLQILVNRALGDFQQLKFALHPGYVRLQ